MNGTIDAVKSAMLSVQRYPWEQGVCAQALWELGDEVTAIAMAHDAVLRQKEDGRLAVINENIAVTDPAANGEVVWHAYERTGDEMYRTAAEKMRDYLLHKAPRTENGCICHNEISFQEGYSHDQIWVDSVYMAPPFLAVMGELDEAVAQIEGYLAYLRNESTGLLYHIYDAGTKQFVRKKLWATGNGWALLGIARVAETALKQGEKEYADQLIGYGKSLLDAMLKYQLTDGRFHDILDEADSFIEGTAAMMTAAFIYRGVAGGWLSENYLKYSDLVRETMDAYVDEFGLIREVCGCPHFMSLGTSAESMAAYLMMQAWYEKANRKDSSTPYYDSVCGTWRLFTDREEEGGALYIASELIRSGVIYPFHSEPPERENHHNHEHDFTYVVEFLLGKPNYFSIDGFEEYYSPQERKMLAELQRKLHIPGGGVVGDRFSLFFLKE